MAQLLVRNLEEDVKRRLQRRAREHGRSTEEEVRAILRDAVAEDTEPGLGTLLAARFADIGLEEELEPLPREAARPANFDP